MLVTDIHELIAYIYDALPQFVAAVVVVLAFNLAIKILFDRILSKPIPISHKICVVGLPRAGKTTLITALFEMIQKGEGVSSARLHGSNTINRVNKSIALMNSGNEVGPTQESDIFVFRFSYIRVRISFLRNLYDVELADFPGEYSDELSKSRRKISRVRKGTVKDYDSLSRQDFSYMLFDREFFSWVASAEEYVFVIDLADTFGRDKPSAGIADISARVRASWQVIEDAVSERGIGRARRRPVHIVFSKFDCLGNIEVEQLNVSINENNQSESSHAKQVISQGMWVSDLSIKVAIDRSKSKKLEFFIQAQFEDLIKFFENRGVKTDLIFTSMILRENDGSRFGVKQVLMSILP